MIGYDLGDTYLYSTEKEAKEHRSDYVCSPGKHKWAPFPSWDINRYRYSEHDNNIERLFTDKAKISMCQVCNLTKWEEEDETMLDA